MNLLLAEDDPLLADALCAQMRRSGFEVEHAPNGAVAEYLLVKQPFDVAVLDLGLPMIDGLTVLKHVRVAKPALPVLILTALDSLEDRVAGLNAGADDYLTKPFEERELLARIRSVLRRTGAIAATPQAARTAAPHGKLAYQGWTLDQDAGLFRSNSGAEAMLTGNECRLLAHLIRNAGHVQTREDLMDKVLSREWDPMDRSIDVLITRLRHKIEVDPKRPLMIKTVRGAGYILSPDDGAATSHNAA